MSFPVVGMVGAGQLARMCAQAAIGLGVKFTVLAADAQESAAQVVPATVIGNHDSLDDLLAFARDCDVITFDHEHVPTEHLDALIAAGIAVRPGPHALVNAQDKLQMRTTLSAAGIPAPLWREVTSAEDVVDFAATAGWPVVLKTARGGYDGKGVMVVSSAEEAAVVLSGSNVRWLVEEKVDFTCELAVQVARSPHGQAAVYPVVQTIQRDGICREVIAPAPIDEDTAMQAQAIALQIAQLLDVTGMLAVEMFLTANGVVVNELAMRPHNSGHWTIDGAVTSQFEQHLRAVLDLPLGSTAALAPHVVMINVLGGDHPDMYHAYLHCMARDPGLKIHMYGKEVRPGRKVGHVTVVGDDLEDLLERGRHAAAYLTGEITE
ncbi:MAG: 5-(carboxyamino)imidazole ribonucleotide synthase [Actinobacteria bacterium]|nr:5-(carboxyamino)imidazole ribonucleotide synthase [Actinomycetota bacterium]